MLERAFQIQKEGGWRFQFVNRCAWYLNRLCPLYYGPVHPPDIGRMNPHTLYKRWNSSWERVVPTKKDHIAVIFWWCGAGLNRRHKDFQSFALPTELPHPSIVNYQWLMINYSWIPDGGAKIREFPFPPKGFRSYNKLKIRWMLVVSADFISQGKLLNYQLLIINY